MTNGGCRVGDKQWDLVARTKCVSNYWCLDWYVFDHVLINLKIIIQHYNQAKDYILAISKLGAIWTLKHAKENLVNMALAIRLQKKGSDYLEFGQKICKSWPKINPINLKSL
jgi:hypothetical protein